MSVTGPRSSHPPAADGYCYGVMFSDNSTAGYWTGRTQRARAIEYLERTLAAYPETRDRITLARARPGERWVRYAPATDVSTSGPTPSNTEKRE